MKANKGYFFLGTCIVLSTAVFVGVQLYMHQNFEYIQQHGYFYQLVHGQEKKISMKTLLEQEIEAGIERYVAKQQEKQQGTQYQQDQKIIDKATKLKLINEHDVIVGDPNAEYSMVVFADMKCQFCQAFHTVVKGFMEKHPDKINLVYKHMPLPMHNPEAMDLAILSKCVGQVDSDLYVRFLDLAFTQPDVYQKFDEMITQLFENHNETTETIFNCMRSEEINQQIHQDLDLANNLEIRGIPTTLVLNNHSNSITVLHGTKNEAQLNTLIFSHYQK